MISGAFSSGQIVNGRMPTSVTPGAVASPTISFRVANSNHKYGPISSPTDVFTTSPYDENYTIPAQYSSSSIILNVDTRSLAESNQSLYRGWIRSGMRLRTSTGEAEVTNVRLFTDQVGTIIGSFFIPDPTPPTNPSFEVGTKVFRLTSNPTNSQIVGLTDTSGSESYFASGTLNNVQETIRSTRKARFDRVPAQESIPATDVQVTTSTTTSSSTSVTPLPPPPPPPPPPPSHNSKTNTSLSHC